MPDGAVNDAVHKIMASEARSVSEAISIRVRNWSDRRSMGVQEGCPELPGFVLFEELGDLGVAQRLVAIIKEQVLLRDVGDIFRLVVFSKQMIVGLILVRTNFFGYGLPPFLGVGELRVDVENETAKRVEPVPYHISDLETGGAHFSFVGRHLNCDLYKLALHRLWPTLAAKAGGAVKRSPLAWLRHSG